MEWECLKCGADNVSDFPFGDDVTCAACGAEHATDWDYVDKDSMTAWVVGLVVHETPTPKGET